MEPQLTLELPDSSTDRVTSEHNQQLFNLFEDIVVKKFGVTPSTFMEKIERGGYTEADITQAISVTRRAKFNQEITKNIAGFFLKSIGKRLY